MAGRAQPIHRRMARSTTAASSSRRTRKRSKAQEAVSEPLGLELVGVAISLGSVLLAAALATLAPASSDGSLSNVTGAWIAQDTEAASAWIGEMEPGDLRDQMTSKLARYHAAEADMETALEAARQIEDPHRRADTFENALQTWMWRDSKAATEYIEASQEIDARTRWRLLTPR